VGQRQAQGWLAARRRLTVPGTFKSILSYWFGSEMPRYYQEEAGKYVYCQKGIYIGVGPTS